MCAMHSRRPREDTYPDTCLFDVPGPLKHEYKRVYLIWLLLKPLLTSCASSCYRAWS